MLPAWEAQLRDQLFEKYGDKQGLLYSEKYTGAIPAQYVEKNQLTELVNDIAKIELLDESNAIEVRLCHANDSSRQYAQIRLLQYNRFIPLSDILPILDNLGLRVYRQESYDLKIQSDKQYTITLFDVDFTNSTVNKNDHTNAIFENALKNIVNQDAENDEFNKLIITAELHCSQVNIIRAYAKYLNQIGFRYSCTYIVKALLNNINISRELISLFENKHNPQLNEEDRNLAAINDTINEYLNHVNDINEDNIIRRYQSLIDHTARTNYFKNSIEGTNKNYLTLKLMTDDMPYVPKPKSLIDTFVYSAEFEGIHLRCSKVSRGGIRWSDRHDDYRTEILGLMKSQKIKNAIIIPSGAKGGFIVKKNLDESQEAIPVEHYYRQFVRGLLDVTDDMKNGQIVKPSNMVCYDDDDAYLVIAADKGTAKFSNIANEISQEYDFWLGDAFATGGKYGYDHKVTGITARGAWEVLKRGLQKLDLSNNTITVTGIGDMSGDVFGNAMIYSAKMKLIAAFNDKHIFIDPNPNPEISHQERLRLFRLQNSTWDDYNRGLISNGGGVYQRNQKTIKVTDEMKSALDIDGDEIEPDDLICAILKAPVNVLFNGGIGTYIKASNETSEDVGEKTNELCRINGDELRCDLVCEGGDQGLTQLARVEYALNGGTINTDFIDNSAGVNCSDHEVNIKIFLNGLVHENKLSVDHRNELLHNMRDQVCDLVLQENYEQALVMSFSSLHAFDYADLYQDHITKLESIANLDRRQEFLPTDKELTQRKTAGKGLTKPELSVLLAYTKIYVKDELLKSNIDNNDLLLKSIQSAFPAILNNEFGEAIQGHLLKKEIAATMLSNSIINTMGITFPFRLQDETGASIQDIVTVFCLVTEIFDTPMLYAAIRELDGKADVRMQYKLYHTVRQLVNMAARWFLRNGRINNDLNELAQQYTVALQSLKTIIPTLIVGDTKKSLEKNVNKFVGAGLTDDVAVTIATLRVMYTALNISEVSHIHHFDLIETAHTYFEVGQKFGLVWIRDFLAKDNRPGKRSSHARLTIRDNLDMLQRRLAILIMQSDVGLSDKKQAVSNWIESHTDLNIRWTAIQKELSESQDDSYTSYFTALHELSEMMDGVKNLEQSHLLAYHDPLTSLPNRLSMVESIDLLRQRYARDKNIFAVHFLDLNKFKPINDTYGHDIGDKVLIAFTKKLLSCIRSGDIVARLAGDEFVILQANVANDGDATDFANRVLDVIREPVTIDDIEFELSASIGIALYPVHGKTTLELINNADHAMYKSKSAGVTEPTVVEVV